MGRETQRQRTFPAACLEWIMKQMSSFARKLQGVVMSSLKTNKAKYMHYGFDRIAVMPSRCPRYNFLGLYNEFSYVFMSLLSDSILLPFLEG